MNTRAMLAIVRKDLKVVSQNKGVALPIIIAPLVLFGVLPLLVMLLPSVGESLGVTPDNLSNIQALINRMPPAIKQELSAYSGYQIFTVYFLVYLMASLFLIIPIMVSSVMAADSFAGEKERKTMEALLYTPTTDRELFVAKLISCWMTAIVVALVSFLLYVIMANVAAWPQLHRIFFPNIMWLVMIMWVVPSFAGLGLSIMVLASSRSQGFQDASQIGGVAVMPILILALGEVSGAMAFNVPMVLLLGLVIWLLDGLLIWLGSRTFRRGRLLGA
jgi:ABC-2 type transport system permease protein